MKMIGKLAIAVGLALAGLAPALPAQAQSTVQAGDVHAAAHGFLCTASQADSNGYFFMPYYGGALNGACIANAGKLSVNRSGWNSYHTGNNRGVIEVRTGSGLYYKQPFEKWIIRWLGQDDTVISVEIY